MTGQTEPGGATRHDGGHAATRIDQGRGGTRRDRDGDGGFVSVNLPPGLAERFVVVKQLRTQGAEASVLVVDDTHAEGDDDQRQRLLKLYHPGIQLRTEAVDVLLSVRDDEVGPDHVVVLHDAEIEEGLWYEVQEYCPHGSLRTVLHDHHVDAMELAREVGAALSYLEGLHLFHRDVKPDNLLVRKLDPLDIVVADFGLARDAAAGSVLWTVGGTIAYQPPEAGRNRVTRAWDWWSAGMVVAEVALGRHPLADENGVLPPPVQIIDRISDEPVDVSGIADERLRNLCRGLLVRDPDRRWRARQVDAWLAGNDPEVPADTGHAVTVPTGPGSSVHFGGDVYTDPTELAAAFQQRWDHAIEHLFHARDKDWLAELDAFLRDRGLAAAAQIVAKGTLASGDLPTRLAKLLMEMDPDLQPVFDGVRLTPAGLQQAGLAVLRGERSSAKLRQVRETGVLSLWSTLPGMRNDRTGSEGREPDHRSADDIDDAWQESCRLLDELVAQVRAQGQAPSTDAVETAKVRLLLCAVDSRHFRDLRNELKPRSTKAERRTLWWRALAEKGETSPPAAALATLLRPEARHAAALAEQAQRDKTEAHAPTRLPRRRSRLTQRALGIGVNVQFTALATALLVAPLWLVHRFEAQVRWFVVNTSGPDDDRTYWLSENDLDGFLGATGWVIAITVAFVAAQLTGMWLSNEPQSPPLARTYVVVSAVVQFLAALAMGIGAAFAVQVAFIATSYDDKIGFPDDYLPDWCKALWVAVVVIIGAVVVALRSLGRFLTAISGGEVTYPGAR